MASSGGGSLHPLPHVTKNDEEPGGCGHVCQPRIFQFAEKHDRHTVVDAADHCIRIRGDNRDARDLLLLVGLPDIIESRKRAELVVCRMDVEGYLAPAVGLPFITPALSIPSSVPFKSPAYQPIFVFTTNILPNLVL
jgi:hypothetical protein